MLLFTTIAALRCYLGAQGGKQSQRVREVGLVPTMGALHFGHLSLIERARQQNDVVIVSIFVNPLQFGLTEDFQKYPRQLEEDLLLCEQAGVDAIFAPASTELCSSQMNNSGVADDLKVLPPATLTLVVPPESMTSVLCGRSRVGHFQGVATIVSKLLNLVQPHRAYFGQKDAQQVAIIRRVVMDLNLPVEIVACPIIRESSGLALSSRNQYLRPEERNQASVLYRSLRQAEVAFQAGERSTAELIAVTKLELATVPGVVPEYVELVDPNTLSMIEQIEEVGLLALAARVGTTRLIDNILLRNRQPIVAIDGPAGAGKSTIARQVAQALKLLYLDTGAMYRAVTWLILQSGISTKDEAKIAEIVSKCDIQLAMGNEPQSQGRVWINGEEVTQAIRTLEVTSHVSALAAQTAVRQELVKQQQRWGEKGGIVIEGRDIGTHVFPDAELKIFLTASVQERARRRQKDLKNQGEANLSLEQMQQNLSERDWKDSSRDVAPLRKAPDAIEIQTDNLSIAEVTDRIVTLYRQKVEGLRSSKEEG